MNDESFIVKDVRSSHRKWFFGGQHLHARAFWDKNVGGVGGDKLFFRQCWGSRSSWSQEEVLSIRWLMRDNCFLYFSCLDWSPVQHRNRYHLRLFLFNSIKNQEKGVKRHTSWFICIFSKRLRFYWGFFSWWDDVDDMNHHTLLQK